MFILPIIIVPVVLLIVMIFEASDYRVYSRGLRLDLLGILAIISIVPAGIISFILYIGGLR